MGLPVLFVDVDGVISVYGFEQGGVHPGKFHMVDGIVHHIGAGMGDRLIRLSSAFELVWATGWGDRANEHLPHLLGLPDELPTVIFNTAAVSVHGHWKLEGLENWIDPDHPVAWIDDGHDEACEKWAKKRPGPTLLVTTDPSTGMTNEHVDTLLSWSASQKVAERANRHDIHVNSHARRLTGD